MFNGLNRNIVYYIFCSNVCNEMSTHINIPCKRKVSLLLDCHSSDTVVILNIIQCNKMSSNTVVLCSM